MHFLSPTHVFPPVESLLWSRWQTLWWSQETQETRVKKIPWKRAWQLTPVFTSCLENPMDRGAWRAIAHRVTKSQTWLKRLSTHTLSYLEASFWPSVLNVDALLLSTASRTGAIMPLWEALQWKHMVIQPGHSSGPQPFRKLGPVLWKTTFPQSEVWSTVLRWFKCITFIVYFISIIASAPPQISRHQIPEVGDPWALGWESLGQS